MDVLTLTIVNLFIAAAAGVLLLLLYSSNKQQHLLYWVSGAACMLLSSALAVSFHLEQPLPYWLAPAFSNSLIVCLHLALLAGLYKYFNQPLRLHWLLLAALMIYALHFTDFAQHSIAHRLFLNFPVIISLNLLSLRLLVKQHDTRLQGVHLAFIMAFCFNIAQLSLRFMLLLSEQLQLTLFTNSQFIHSLGFFGLTTFATLVFGCSILLVYQQQQLALQQRSERDALTGVLNRHSMAQKITTELDRCQRLKSECSLVMVDIDHFKQVNDQHGHVAGDAALKAVAALSAEQLRSYDLLFRYGGEEFVICLPDSDAKTAKQVAGRIRHAIEQLVLADYPQLRLTVSLGVASSVNAETWQDLLLQADQALYSAKHNGRNRICHFNGLSATTS